MAESDPVEAKPQYWWCAKHGVVEENLEFHGLDPKIDGLYCMHCWGEHIRIQCQKLTPCNKDGERDAQ